MNVDTMLLIIVGLVFGVVLGDFHKRLKTLEFYERLRQDPDYLDVLEMKCSGKCCNRGDKR
jgi:hypothetical protein